MHDAIKATGPGKGVTDQRPDLLAGTNLADPAVTADPPPVYGRLQADTPVAWSAQLHGWVVTGYELARKAMLHPGLSVEKLEPFTRHSSARDRKNVETLGEVLGDWMVFKDPPTHTQLRRSLKDAFMPAEIRELEPRVRAIVDGLLAGLPQGEPVDVVERFAFPLPAMVIGDLFGMPRDELETLKAWSDDLGKFVLASVDADQDRIYLLAGEAARRMKARFQIMLDDHRTNPREDFTSRMIANSEGLTDDQIVHNLVLLLWAGHETTTNLIATSIHHLCSDPMRFEQLRANPALVPGTVEECLRMDGPAQMLVRFAKEDMDLDGHPIGQDEMVYLMINTANRDPSMFDAPEDFDAAREVNKHLGFGRGIHMCLGAPLARLEGEQALHGLAERFTKMGFAGTATEWRQNLIIRGPRKLEVLLAG
jgi:cytochrome P450